MTKKERLIVSAYTGVLMCDMGDLQKYIEGVLGRPIWTLAFTDKGVLDEIREKTKADFLALCKD